MAISLAQVYAREHDFAAARRVLTDAATTTADQRQAALAWMALGRLGEQEGDRDDAEQSYRAAVKADDSVLTNCRFAQFLEYRRGQGRLLQ